MIPGFTAIPKNNSIANNGYVKQTCINKDSSSVKLADTCRQSSTRSDCIGGALICTDRFVCWNNPYDSPYYKDGGPYPCGLCVPGPWDW